MSSFENYLSVIWYGLDQVFLWLVAIYNKFFPAYGIKIIIAMIAITILLNHMLAPYISNSIPIERINYKYDHKIRSYQGEASRARRSSEYRRRYK